MREIFVIMHQNKTLHNIFFEDIDIARNYIKFTFPYKKFKEPVENIFISTLTGSKFEIIKLFHN